MRIGILVVTLLLTISTFSKCEPLNQTKAESILEAKLKESEELKHSETEKSIKLAEEVFNQSNVVTSKIKSAIVIGHILTNKGDFQGAKSIIDQALQMAQNQESPLEKVKIIPYLANVYLKFGKIDEAMRIYKNLGKEAKRLNFTDGTIMSNTGIGICNMYLDPYDSSASYYYHAALKMAKETKNKKFQGLINNNLGRLYLERKEYTKAISYLEKSMSLSEDSGNKRSVARSLLALSEVYYETGYYQKAIETSIKSDSISYRQKDYQNIVHIKVLQGNILNDQSSQTSNSLSKNHYENAIDIAKEYDLKIDLQDALMAYGRSLSAIGLTDEAINILNQALVLANTLNIKKKIAETQTVLSQIHEKNGQFQLALELFKKQSKYYVDENKLQSNRVVQDLEVKYKIRETNLKVQEIEFENRIKDQKYAQNRTIMVLTIVILSVIIAFIFLNHRTNQKNTRLVYEKNEAILIAKNTEITKNKEIESAKAELKGQESERTRLAKELHDGLGGTLAAIKLNLSAVQKSSKEQTKLNTIIEKLDNACNEVRTISHHLTPPAFQGNQMIEAIHDYFNDMNEGSTIDMNIEIFPKNDIERIESSIKTDIYRIIQELTYNSIKHSNATNLDVQLVKYENYLSLMVEDDGIGFSANDKMDGIGFKNIRSRIALLNGTVNIESHPGNGTLVDLKIPI